MLQTDGVSSVRALGVTADLGTGSVGLERPEDLRDATIPFPAPGHVRADSYDTFVTWYPTESNVDGIALHALAAACRS